MMMSASPSPLTSPAAETEDPLSLFEFAVETNALAWSQIGEIDVGSGIASVHKVGRASEPARRSRR